MKIIQGPKPNLSIQGLVRGAKKEWMLEIGDCWDETYRNNVSTSCN